MSKLESRLSASPRRQKQNSLETVDRRSSGSACAERSTQTEFGFKLHVLPMAGEADSSLLAVHDTAVPLLHDDGMDRCNLICCGLRLFRLPNRSAS